MRKNYNNDWEIMSDEDKEEEANLNFQRVVFYGGLILFLGIAYVKNKYFEYKENIVKEITQEYTDDLDEIISSSSDKNIDKYQEVAKYIQETKNPDLALFALYDQYNEKDPYIMYETSKYLQYDSNDDIININYCYFDQYLSLNNFDSESQYKTYVIDEVYNDYKNKDEINLDDINVKVNKKPLTLEKKDDNQND